MVETSFVGSFHQRTNNPGEGCDNILKAVVHTAVTMAQTQSYFVLPGSPYPYWKELSSFYSVSLDREMKTEPQKPMQFLHKSLFDNPGKRPRMKGCAASVAESK